MNPDTPQLNNYRLEKLEEGMIETRKEIVQLHAEHENRLRNIEDFVTRAGAGGVPLKTVFLIASVVATIIGGILAAVLKAAGIQ